jgi:hypothetical protein
MSNIDPGDVMSVYAATVRTNDEVWYAGAFRRVVRIEFSTPLPGRITWTLDGIPEHPAVEVSAIKKVALKRS